MLAMRLITGSLLAAALTAGIFLLPDFWFECLMLAVGVAAGLEWGRLCGVRELSRRIGHVALIAALFVAMLQFESYAVLLNGIAVLFWAGIAGYLIYPMVKSEHGSSCLACSALILASAMFAASGLQDGSRQGAFWLLGAFATVALADSGAYFVGKAFGKRKLAVHISPGKTIEGVAGGMFCVLVFALIAGFIAWPQNPVKIASLAAICMLTAILSVFGDLFVSKAKRSAGVKDSGAILPGHGGILDRIDSSLAALPAYAFFTKSFLIQT